MGKTNLKFLKIRKRIYQTAIKIYMQEGKTRRKFTQNFTVATFVYKSYICF